MKKNLLLILITSLSAILSACGTDTQSTNANFPKESESEFYENELQQDGSFELLQSEMTLECETPFDTDDLSKYIKAENYDNILINIYLIEKTKSEITETKINEDSWDEVGLLPATFNIVFEDYSTGFTKNINVIYEDTIPPTINITGSNVLNYYQLELDDTKNTGDILTIEYSLRKKSEDVSSLGLYAIYLSDGTFFDLFEYLVEIPAPSSYKKRYFKKLVLINGKEIQDGDKNSMIAEFPSPGSYEIEYCVTDPGDNTSSAKFIFNVIEDISPEEKESLSEEKYQQLYNDYISAK